MANGIILIGWQMKALRDKENFAGSLLKRWLFWDCFTLRILTMINVDLVLLNLFELWKNYGDCLIWSSMNWLLWDWYCSTHIKNANHSVGLYSASQYHYTKQHGIIYLKYILLVSKFHFWRPKEFVFFITTIR